MATKKRRRPSPAAPAAERLWIVEDAAKLRHGLGLIAGEAKSLQRTLDALAGETHAYLDAVTERLASKTVGGITITDLDNSPAWMNRPALRHRQTVLTTLASELSTKAGRLAVGAEEMQKQLPAGSWTAAPPADQGRGA